MQSQQTDDTCTTMTYLQCQPELDARLPQQMPLHQQLQQQLPRRFSRRPRQQLRYSESFLLLPVAVVEQQRCFVPLVPLLELAGGGSVALQLAAWHPGPQSELALSPGITIKGVL